MTPNRMLIRCAVVAALMIPLGARLHAAPPNLGGVNPNRGPTTGGTIVTISGINFTGATAVTFGGVDTADFFVLDDTRITVATPPREAGLVNVSVTNPDGTGTQTNAFLYVAVATAMDDAYETPVNTPLTVEAPGVLENDDTMEGGTMTASPWTGPSNGGVVLSSDGSFTYTPNTGFMGVDSFTYRVSNDEGLGGVGTVTITVGSGGGGPPGSPSGLNVWSIIVNEVTLRWTAPTGSAPTRYVIECGLGPGQVMLSLATNDATAVLTFNAPTGVLFCRVHALVDTERSPASNEITIFVNVASVPPSAPADLAAVVNASSLGLSWRNTFNGGTPSTLVIDVTGSITTSLPLGPGESTEFSGVPAGTYTLSLRAVNAAGSSAQSNAVTVTFPGPCSGAPATPPNFLAYRVGNTIFVIWGPSPAGSAAATIYVVNVSGSFVGSLPTMARVISGTAPSGSYSLSVVAMNACGTSPSTAVVTVVIP